jgi:hypothetical protein
MAAAVAAGLQSVLCGDQQVGEDAGADQPEQHHRQQEIGEDAEAGGDEA